MGKWCFSGKLTDRRVGRLHVYSLWWSAHRTTHGNGAQLNFLQNRRLPIIAYSLLAYWRVNRSLDNPVRMESRPNIIY